MSTPIRESEEGEGEICVASYTKGKHTYIFKYRDNQVYQAIGYAGRLAHAGETNFTWTDAARFAAWIRQAHNL